MQKIKILILLLAIFNAYSINAQVSVSSSYNDVHIGRNINIMILKTIKKHTLGIGSKFHLNNLEHDNQNNIYKKRFYAVNTKEHIGLNFFYQYILSLKRVKFVSFLVFYDFQYTNSHTRNQMFLPYTYAPDGSVLYKEYFENFGPFKTFENMIGIGAVIPINDNIFITQKMGGGILFISGKDYRLPSTLFKTQWELGHVISVGIGCKFNNKKKNNSEQK